MATGNVMPQPLFVGLDSNGAPLNGGKLYAYAAGTTTAQDTYTASDLLTPNANPVVLDSAGRATVFLSSNSYKFKLLTSADVEVWTQDNVQAITLSQTVIGENLPFFGSIVEGVNDTSYPSGTTVDKLAPGTKVLPLDSANVTGTWKIRGMLKNDGGSVTATAALVNLSDGSPDTAIVTITSTSAVGETATSSAVTFAASGASKNYGIKTKSSNASNYVWAWGLELVRTA